MSSGVEGSLHSIQQNFNTSFDEMHMTPGFQDVIILKPLGVMLLIITLSHIFLCV